MMLLGPLSTLPPLEGSVAATGSLPVADQFVTRCALIRS